MEQPGNLSIWDQHHGFCNMVSRSQVCLRLRSGGGEEQSSQILLPALLLLHLITLLNHSRVRKQTYDQLIYRVLEGSIPLSMPGGSKEVNSFTSQTQKLNLSPNIS